MKLLDEIVKEMLETHVGGEKFFDNLDASLQRKSIIEQLFWKIPCNYQLIASGKFGVFLNNTLISHSIIVVPGGLRSGVPLDLSYIKGRIEGRRLYFIDDSFYLGRTRDAIKAEIERLGGILQGTCVIYDGSENKDPAVTSLFRYYDNYRKVET
jgi:hypothetical protein